MKKIIQENKKKNSIELRYAKKPTIAILKLLRASNFTWSPTNKHWYAKKNYKNESFARTLGDTMQLSFSFDENQKQEKKTVAAVKDKNGITKVGDWNKYFKVSDIPYQVAYDAHSGTSFSPEKRAISQQRDYYEFLVSCYNEIFKNKKYTPERKEKAENLFIRFVEGYKKRSLAYLRSRSGLMSTMITGASNFPVRRMNKKNDVIHKRLNELVEYQDRISKIKVALKPDHLKPIKTGQSNAVTLLEKKLEKLESNRELMKASNKVIKKKITDEAKVAALVKLGLKSGDAWGLLSPDYAGRMGFAPFNLTNTGAEIRRIKSRLELEKRNKVKTAENKATGKGKYKINGVEVFENIEANRIQLFFDGKPSQEIRTGLKRLGFRWSPKNTTWQAYLSSFRSSKMASLKAVLK